MQRYKDQICLVTASSEGIGLAMAERMAAEGGVVHICSRKQNAIDKAVNLLKEKNLHVYGHVCDMADKQARQDMLAKISE